MGARSLTVRLLNLGVNGAYGVGCHVLPVAQRLLCGTQLLADLSCQMVEGHADPLNAHRTRRCTAARCVCEQSATLLDRLQLAAERREETNGAAIRRFHLSERSATSGALTKHIRDIHARNECSEINERLFPLGEVDDFCQTHVQS